MPEEREKNLIYNYLNNSSALLILEIITYFWDYSFNCLFNYFYYLFVAPDFKIIEDNG